MGSSVVARPTMPESVRRFDCADCRRQVFICTACDRGQRYCAGDCARTVRRRSLREANGRYGRTPKGRLKSAERSRRYRDRKKLRDRKNVTDHGSLSDGTLDLLNASATNAAAKTSSNGSSSPIASSESGAAIGNALQCSFCRRGRPRWVRLGPLRRRSPRSGYI